MKNMRLFIRVPITTITTSWMTRQEEYSKCTEYQVGLKIVTGMVMTIAIRYSAK